MEDKSIVRLRNLLVEISRSQLKAEEKIRGLIPDDTQKLIDGTLGIDFLGDRYPIDPRAFLGYMAIEEQFRELQAIFGRDEDLERWLAEERALLYARCQRRENIPVPLAKAVKELTVDTLNYQPVSEEEIRKKLKEMELEAER